MPYTENEINAQLKFFINPSFQKAERFEQKNKSNPCSRNNRRVIW